MSPENLMTRTRAGEILEAYGASPARWPDTERQAMLSFLDDHPELLAEAQSVEAELDGLLGSGHVQPSDLLERRIMRSLPSRQPMQANAGWSWRAPAAAAAAVLLAVSVSVGGGLFAPVNEPADLEELYADALDSYGYDWSDWYSDTSG